MILKAEVSHLAGLALLLRAMYKELFPDHAVDDINVYISEMVKNFNCPKTTTYVDDYFRGFFQVRDETEAMTPTCKRYHGIRVYIIPEERKGRLLKEFYDRLFTDFPDGDIIGVTEITSEHIAVLEKRHKRIANMYVLNRGTR